MSIEDYPDSRGLTILLTGGRAPCTLELARSFHSGGHRVLVAESARYHLCRVSRAVERSFFVPAPNADRQRFLQAIEDIVTEQRVDVLIPTCEEIFFVAQGLESLSRHCNVWCPPLEQLRELHDKWEFVRLASCLRLAVPESRLIGTPQEMLAFGKEALDRHMVLKPVYSRFASRVIFLDMGDSEAKRVALLRKAAASVSPETPWIAQRQVDGRHISTYSIAHEGVLLAHAAYPGRYRIGAGATVYFEPLEHAPSLEWVSRLVCAIGFSGQIAFDFIEEEGGELYALECNPRATSGIHLFGTDGRLREAFLSPNELKASGSLISPERSVSMLAAGMLAAAPGNISSWSGLRSWFGDWRSARDVVFRRGDIKPSIEQLGVLLESWRVSRKEGLTLSQATTRDIEWNGEA
ncbi:ATP-grasp domain-containing protein [Paenibacillus sp. CAU 1782]